LTGVTESGSPETKSYFYEGRRLLFRVIPGPFSGKIEAITYPDVLDELTGLVSYVAGVRVHDSLAKPFHMTYRTLIGSPADGIDHGYKLHLLYYLIANSDDISMKTLGDQLDPTAFSWTINGQDKFADDTTVGETITPGTHVLGHISIDSREVDSGFLTELENALYGTSGSDPGMPDPRNVIAGSVG
jgi:hypothetical protein